MTETANQSACITFLRSKTAFGQQVVDALQPLFPRWASLDLLVTVREGSIRVKLTPLHKGEGWQDRSGG